MKFIKAHNASKRQIKGRCLFGMKMLAGNNESRGEGERCRDSYRSAELEAESSRF